MSNKVLFLLALVLCVSGFTFAETGAVGDAKEEEKKTFSVSEFFTAPQIQYPSISPNGDFVIYKNFGKVMAGTVTSEFKEIVPDIRKEYLSSLQWIGENSFIAKKRNKRTGYISFRVYKVTFDDNQQRVKVIAEDHLEHGGYVVDPVYEDPDLVVFAKYRKEDEILFSDVYRLRFFDNKAEYLRKKQRINKNSGSILSWLTDKNTRLYLGVSYEDRLPVLWIKNPKGRRFKEVWRAEKESRLNPVALDKTGKKLYVITNVNSDKMVAASFDLERFELDEVLYSNESSDVEGLVISPESQQPVAALIYQDGIEQYQFLDKKAEQKYTKINEIFPGERIYIADTAESEDFQIVISISNTSLPKIHFCSVVKQKCNLLDSLYPWLEGLDIARTDSFSITTPDGLNIESYLTLPNGDGPFPLIVMPHGGPIGVRDSSYFSGHKQWLAYNRYAVLQVNYRGSSGFGQFFQNSGLQQWGRGIEDDIESSLFYALAQYPQLDKDNICGFGSSYGGYSVLMGLIRNENLYKCAVSFAGVTDLTLLFNKGSMRNSHKLTRSLIKMVGSPETQMQDLIANSPVYQYQKINKPVMLIHGFADEVVDIEHSFRLSKMLEKHGTAHELVKFNTLEHSFKTYDQLNEFYDKVMPFLTRHLKLD